MRKLAMVVAGLMTVGAGTAMAQGANDDPYLWLEEFTSPPAMSWVEAHNAKTTGVLEADPRYPAYFAEALSLAQAKDRLPAGSFINGKVYNFWQDETHVRGIWRRTSVASFSSVTPHWETVLDLDRLAADEKANLVWKGASCALPAERRCLIELSDGGEDAVTVREYDLVTGKFVAGGFILPKGKQEVSWENENTLLVSREWEPGQLTNSGYAYVVKRLKRGQPLNAATEIYRGQKSDVATAAAVLRDAQQRTLPLIVRGKDFYHNETYLIGPKGVRRLGLPEKSVVHGMVTGRVIVETKEDWHPAGSGATYPAGSLVSLDLAGLRANPDHLRPTLITTAGSREALESAAVTRDSVIATMLDNVRGRLVRFTPTTTGGWSRSVLKLPDNSSVGVADATSYDNRALVEVTSFLVPPSQWLVDAGTGATREIRRQGEKFDTSNLVSEQHEAVSSDGTKIPYFLVHRRDMPLTGNNPTLLYAYGGFEQSMTPSYSSTTGKLWLEKGGVYALANIRGGGEFGPKWHEAGLGTKRQIIYDDFAAVGRDLIARKVTSPRRLGISGGSNGGLQTGVQFTQHPELWNAVIIDVPLLDMIRISKIAAGASWEGEYGSITDPAVRAFWDKTSPYQNLRKGVAYPQPFIFTTTKDDRVGPQHARKFAARMEEMGLPFYFYENTEGGHAAGANLRQTARTHALEMIYLTRKLMDPVEPGKDR